MSTEEINQYVNQHIEEFEEFENRLTKEWTYLSNIYEEWMKNYRGLLFRTELPEKLGTTQPFYGQSIRDLFVSTHLKRNSKSQ